MCLSPARPRQVLQGLVTLDTGVDLATLAAEPAPKQRLSTPGCLMLRHLFSMPQTACRALTDAALSLESAELAAIARDGAGARAIEGLLKVRALTRALVFQSICALRVDPCRCAASSHRATSARTAGLCAARHKEPPACVPAAAPGRAGHAARGQPPGGGAVRVGRCGGEARDRGGDCAAHQRAAGASRAEGLG